MSMVRLQSGDFRIHIRYVREKSFLSERKLKSPYCSYFTSIYREQKARIKSILRGCDIPRDARYHYAKRFGIEASYRLSEQSIATTSTQNPVVRLLYVVVSLLLQNVWRYLHWEYVATPRRGGRRLWKWSFKEFITMIQRAAWTALATRRAVPANRPPDDRFTR